MTSAPMVWCLDGIPRVLWGTLFVWMTHEHSIGNTRRRHATLTTTDSSTPRTIRTGGTGNLSLEIDRREEIHRRVGRYSTTVDDPLTHPPEYDVEHKWTKKSIFWDLPYWGMHLIWHNLDVMHIDKNMFDNIFNTAMDIEGKIKDNLNAQKN